VQGRGYGACVAPDDSRADPTTLSLDPSALEGGASSHTRARSNRSAHTLSSERVGTRLADRFELVRELGEGSSGTVYEALDLAQAGSRVALKLLHRFDARAISRIKSEFRHLADVVHPNLVTLHELFSHGGDWFLTMDLVEGVDFVEYVRRDAASFDRQRLSSALLQLARGVMALHAAGKLHRDLKPNNVLVDASGKLVVVDFGLARDLALASSRHTEQGFVGTPAYAAPEQLDSTRTTAASDWYAVGVMLYEALTGELPFEGSGQDIMHEKRTLPLVRPSERNPDVDEVLDTLCCALLERAPQHRAAGNDILEAIRSSRAPQAHSEPPRRLPFIGRATGLEALHEAFLKSSEGAQVAILVEGASGIGKTALVEHFLEQLKAKTDAEIFTARCYAQENVPYKPLDGIVDGLSRYLRSIPLVRSAALLPRDAHALAKIFPALQRLPALSEVPARSVRLQAESEIRTRGFQALKQLLGALTDRRPVALFIDDIQWSDDDGIDLLRELMIGPDAPPLLIVMTCRREDGAQIAALSRLLAKTSEPMTELRELKLGPLSLDERHALASALSGDTSETRQAAIARIAAQCEGHPMFLSELSQYAARKGPNAETLTLNDALLARVSALSEPARRLLNVICLAGKPLDRSLAFGVAELPEGGSTFQELRVACLARAHTGSEPLRLEPYHDRVRETVAASLDASETRTLHERLAQRFEAEGDRALDEVVAHYAAAGDHTRASVHAEAAAAQAMSALAFNRAIELLTYALAQQTEPARQRDLHVRLAEVCTAAGRNHSAASHLVEAAKHSTSEGEAFDYRRLAMEHLFFGGFDREGAVLLSELSKRAGLRLPTSEKAALPGLAIGLLRLILRGGPDIEGAMRAKDAPYSEREQQRALLMWSAGSRHTTSPLLTGYYLARLLLHSARVGAEAVFAVAVVSWMGFVTARGGVMKDSTRDAAIRLETLITNAPSNVKAWYWAAIGTLYTYNALFAEARRPFELSLELAATQGARGPSPQHFSRTGLLANWFWTGDLTSLATQADTYIRAASEARDQNYAIGLRVLGAMRFLVTDQPNEAFAEHERIRVATEADKHLLVDDPWWVAWIHLYQQTPARGLKQMRQPRRFVSVTTRAAFPRAVALFVEAGCAASMIASGDESPRLRRLLKRNLRRLRRIRGEAVGALRRVLTASLHALEHDQPRAAEELARAAASFDALGMRSFAAAARARRGALLTGRTGEELRRQAHHELSDLGVKRPEAWVDMLAPGFPGASA